VDLIGRADGHRVEILLIEHLPPIDVGFGPGVFRGGGGEVVFVDIAQGHDVFAADAAHIGPAAAVDADNADVEFFVGRVAFGRRAGAGHPEAACGQRGALEKLATIGLPAHR